jgi:RNA polymerase sigma-70 factor (ECF subfamily)
MKCGANEQEAADAAQQAFELLLSKWNIVTNPKAWLRTVAIRQLLPALIIKRRTSSLDEEEGNYTPGISPPITAHIDLREEERLVLEAIRQLSPAQCKVFALWFDDYGSSEIAEILQMTQVAVRQNLARARAALKELLGVTRFPSQDRRAVRELEEENP